MKTTDYIVQTWSLLDHLIDSALNLQERSLKHELKEKSEI